jgi:hypothetical protein
MKDLSVEVRHHDLVVTMPSRGQSVTYRKDLAGPLLVALDSMRHGLDVERLEFLAQAWKAAYAKAKDIGWL